MNQETKVRLERLEGETYADAARRVSNATGVPIGTAKNWVTGRNVPCGKPRALRTRHVDEKLNTMMDLAPPHATYTLQEIGDFVGLTRERVRQIERDALKKIRTYHGKSLREHIT